MSLLESLELSVAAREQEKDSVHFLLSWTLWRPPFPRDLHRPVPRARLTFLSVDTQTDRIRARAATSAFRVALARLVGEFLRRGISGGFRGPSGREQLSLSSKYYIICKDGVGRVHHPRTVTTFSKVKELCFEGANPLPDTDFVGFALAVRSSSCGPDLSAHGRCG